MEIRLFKADGQTYRVLPGNVIIGQATARVTATEGYGEAHFELAGTMAAYPDLVRRRMVEFWARYRFRGDTADRLELLYSGYVALALPKVGDDGLKSVDVTLGGIWGMFASGCRTRKRYANTNGDDRSTVFGDLATRYVQQNYATSGPSIDVLTLPVGDLSWSYIDAYKKRFGDVAGSLATTVGLVAVGGDKNWATGNARLFFRPYDDLTQPATHTVIVPGPQIGSYEREIDTSRQATVLNLTGGQALFKNLVAQSTGNPSFEAPLLPGSSSAGNLVVNPSFESGPGNGPTAWSLQSGALTRIASDDGTQPYDGNRYLKLPSTNAAAYQILTPAEMLTVGTAYTLACRARVANEFNLATGELRLKWLDSSGNQTGATVALSITPGAGTHAGVSPVTWDLFTLNNVTPPTGATHLSLQPYCTSGGGAAALLIDVVQFYISNQTTQAGWEPMTYPGQSGSSAATYTARWDDDTAPWHGGRCVYLATQMNASLPITDGQDLRLQAAGFARFDVGGGQEITGGFAVKLADATTSYLVWVELWEWKADGSYIGATRTPVTITGSGWQIITATRQYNEDGRQGTLALDLRDNGSLYVDGAFAYDAAAFTGTPAAITLTGTDSSQYIEGDRFETVLRADALFAVGTPIHTEAVAVGDVEADDTQANIGTYADAVTYGIAYFNKYALGIDRPNLLGYGVLDTGGGHTTASMMPGESVRAIGAGGADLLPAPLPCAEKEITFDSGTLSIKPMFQANPRDPARTIEQLIQRQIASGLLAASYGSAVGGGGSSSGGYPGSEGGVSDS